MHTHVIEDRDKHFVIDAITRKIVPETPEKNKLVQNDHNSEKFTFEIPKTIEGHNMSLCDIVEIHYLNISSDKSKRQPGIVTVADFGALSGDPQKCAFTWTIDRNCTKYEGILSFAIRFACSGKDAPEYEWYTLQHSGITISSTLFNGPVIVEQYVDILQKWYNDLVAAKPEVTLNETVEGVNIQVKTGTNVQNAMVRHGAAGVIDNTLTVPNQAADAKAVGDKFGTKVDKMQGVENTGKELIVGADGNVVCRDSVILPLEDIVKFGATCKYQLPNPNKPTFRQYGILLKPEFDAGLTRFKVYKEGTCNIMFGTYVDRKMIASLSVSPTMEIHIENRKQEREFFIQLGQTRLTTKYDELGNLVETTNLFVADKRHVDIVLQQGLATKLDKAQGAPNANKNVETDASGNVIFIDKEVIPKSLSELTEDATHRVVTDTEKQTWNGKSDFSGNYNDLTNKPTIPSIPSALPNPNVLTFTGAVTGSYDGSQPLSVDIPKVNTNSKKEFVKVIEHVVTAEESKVTELKFTSAMYPDIENATEIMMIITGNNKSTNQWVQLSCGVNNSDIIISFVGSIKEMRGHAIKHDEYWLFSAHDTTNPAITHNLYPALHFNSGIIKNSKWKPFNYLRLYSYQSFLEVGAKINIWVKKEVGTIV